MFKNIQRKDYKHLFSWEEQITALNSEILLKGGLRHASPLAIHQGIYWYTFIKKKGEDNCGKKWFAVLKSKVRYNKWKKDYLDYIDFSKRHIKRKYSGNIKNLTKSEFNGLYKNLQKFWTLYALTEWPAYNFSYRRLKKEYNGTLKDNLEDIAKIKAKGRETMNDCIFMDGVIPSVLRYFSKRYLNDKTDGYYLFLDELRSLFDRQRDFSKVIAERRKCFSVAMINNRFRKFNFQESWSLLRRFKVFKKEDFVKGTAANKGHAKGKVVVVPGLTSKTSIKKSYNQMKQGDVLVAHTTSPELIGLCKKASAIITDQGGMLSHAAVVSRELNIPCIIETNVATRVLGNGDLIEVDADKGMVKILKRKK